MGEVPHQRAHDLDVLALDVGGPRAAPTSASVRSRPSARASVRGGEAISFEGTERSSYGGAAGGALCATPRRPRAPTPCARRSASRAAGRRARSGRTRAARARSPARGSGGPSCRRARCRRRRCPSTWSRRDGGSSAPAWTSISVPWPHAGKLGGAPDGPRATSSQTAPCSATLAARSVRTATMLVRSAASARPSAARKLLDVVRDLVAEAEQRGGVREVEPVRGGDVLDVLLALAAHRQEVEDPAAVVVQQHDRELEARAGAAASSPPRSWISATSPMRSTAGPSAAAAHTEGGRDGPVDPVRAAVGEHARRRLAAPGRTSRRRAPASRTRRRSSRPAGSADAELGGDPRLAQARRARAPVRSPPRRRGRRGASAPARRLAARLHPAADRRRASCRGSAARIVATAPAGSCQAPSGSKRELQGVVEPVQPAAQRLGGGEVADAEHEARARARRPTRRRAAARRSGRSRPAPRRAPDSGSASSGIAAQLGEAGQRGGRAAGRARRGRPRSPRAGAPAAPSRRRVDQRRRRLGGDRGPRDPRAPAVAAAGSSSGSGASSTSGSRRRSSGARGRGGPSSAVQYARQASWRSQRSRSGVAGWSSTSRYHLAALP